MQERVTHIPFIKEALRIQYEQPPSDTAASILGICDRLSSADGAPFIDRLKIYSSEDLIALKRFLVDIQEIERIALDEEQKAVKELQNMTAGTNLDDISQQALKALKELVTLLEGEEV